MPSTIIFRVVCPLVPYLKASILKYTKLCFYLLFVWVCYHSLCGKNAGLSEIFWLAKRTNRWMEPIIIDSLLHCQSPPNIIPVIISRSILTAGNWAHLEGNFCSVRLGLLIYGLFSYPHSKKKVWFSEFLSAPSSFQTTKGHSCSWVWQRAVLNKQFFPV